jgi:nucleoid DNA-binding protein
VQLHQRLHKQPLQIMGMFNFKCRRMNKPEECMSNDLQIAVKAKTRPRFKAGAELSKTVNRVEVNVDQ